MNYEELPKEELILIVKNQASKIKEYSDKIQVAYVTSKEKEYRIIALESILKSVFHPEDVISFAKYYVRVRKKHKGDIYSIFSKWLKK